MSVIRAAGVLMAGRVASLAITAMIPVVLVRYMDQHAFGTYKQLFLISTTVFLIAPCGMATSLYYFLPRAGRAGARYVANAAVFLALSSLLAVPALWLSRFAIAQALNNPALPAFMLPTALYTVLWMVTMPLEIVMICRSQHAAATAAYAASDALRVACFLLPVILGGGLEGLMWGGVAAVAVRLVALVGYARREYPGDLVPDLGLMREQLAYAVPFGLTVLLEVAEGTFHQYFVSSRFDAATFAIYAAGCLQIPLVDLVGSPVGDVMMVKMREARVEGRPGAALALWHDTTAKLAFVFFPMTVGSLVVARELMVVLFTPAYAASVPIFMAWSLGILLSAVMVEGVLRVHARTRLLLFNNAVRLGVTVALIGWFVGAFGLVGAVLVTLLARVVSKVAGLLELRMLLAIAWSELLPWRRLAGVLAMAAVSALPALLLRQGLDAPPVVVLLATGLAYAAAYGLLALAFGPVRRLRRLAWSSWAVGRSS